MQILQYKIESKSRIKIYIKQYIMKIKYIVLICILLIISGALLADLTTMIATSVICIVIGILGIVLIPFIDEYF